MKNESAGVEVVIEENHLKNHSRHNWSTNGPNNNTTPTNQINTENQAAKTATMNM